MDRDDKYSEKPKGSAVVNCLRTKFAANEISFSRNAAEEEVKEVAIMRCATMLLQDEVKGGGGVSATHVAMVRMNDQQP